MKKFLTIALAALFAGNAMALDNEPESGLSYQVFLGFNASNMKNFVDGNAHGYIDGNKFDGKVGVNVGFKLEYMLPNAKGTYLNAGINWAQKGAKKKGLQELDYSVNPAVPLIKGGYNTAYTRKIQAHYLEIPIHVGWRYNIKEDWGVFGEIGPYFAVGVTGKNRLKYDEDALDDSHDMTFGKNVMNYQDKTPTTDGSGNQVMSYSNASLKEKAIQRFDFGFGFRIGAEYNNQYSLNLGYDWGITDAYLDGWRKAYQENHGSKLKNLKNRNLTITFGYRF